VQERFPTQPQPPMAVLVPIKAFTAAKVRLAPALDPPGRAHLARGMAASVLRAAGTLPAAVVCDDEEVRSWAVASGAEAIWTPGLGLNGAVAAGVAHLASRGARRVIVAHADLPLATDLAWVGRFAGVTLVPDRHGDGTNVACVPADAGFTFGYGPGSCARHRAEGVRLGLPVRIVADRRLGWDVDVPGDLDLPADLAPAPLPEPAEVPCP